MSRAGSTFAAMTTGSRVAIGMVALGLSATAASAETPGDGAPSELTSGQPLAPHGPPAPNQSHPGLEPFAAPESSGPIVLPVPLVTVEPRPAAPSLVTDAARSGEIGEIDDDAAARASVFDGCRFPDAGTGESTLDAKCAFDLLQRRYRGLQNHRERGELVEEIDLGDSVVRRTETRIDCTIDDGRFTVDTTARRIRTLLGRMVPIRTGPGVENAVREIDSWMVPHAVLQSDDAGSLDPSAADEVRIDDRAMIRLELEGDGDRVALFVNPETVLVERALGERALPDGGRWRGQLDIEAVGPTQPFIARAADGASTASSRERSNDTERLTSFTADDLTPAEPADAPPSEDVTTPEFGG